MTASAVPATSAAAGAPVKAKAVVATLIIMAAVANLPLAISNVALPSIGAYFDATQTQLNLVAVAYSLGLACSVLWLGALGDRCERKMMAIRGVALAIPAAFISGSSPTIQVLIVGRLFGGFAAGTAYPTTLALIARWGAGPGTHPVHCAVGGHHGAGRPAALFAGAFMILAALRSAKIVTPTVKAYPYPERLCLGKICYDSCAG